MKFAYQFPRWVSWGLAFPLIVFNGWLLIVVFRYFQSLMTVLVVATLLAFILNYPVRWLTSHQINRSFAVFGVAIAALVLLGVLGVTLAPIIFQQLNGLAERLPSWLESGDQQLQALNAWANSHNIPIDLSVLTTQITARLSGELRSFTGQLLGFVLGTVGSVLDLLLTLVLTVYLLLHGERLWEGIFQWLPAPVSLQIRPLLRQNFHNYYVGQASIAAIMGASMTIAFWLLRVPFSLLFGLGIGLMALFPFGGTFSICVVSLLIALKSFWLGARVLVVALILEQIIGNGVAPRLLGEFIGLNPVLIIVSLLIGAKIAGILGLLIAVPVAGFIKSTATVLRDNALSSPMIETVPVAQEMR